MPINLSETEAVVVPETVIPPINASVAWIETIRIYAPMGGTWQAITESHPTDGTQVYRRDANGNDTAVIVKSDNLQADMAKDPSLIADVDTALRAIVAVTAKIKAIRAAEAIADEG